MDEGKSHGIPPVDNTPGKKGYAGETSASHTRSSVAIPPSLASGFFSPVLIPLCTTSELSL